MRYGICHLSIVPVRFEPSDRSEMVSQLLYGEHFKILEHRKKWSKIRISFDRYEGWVDNEQFKAIDKNEHKALEKDDPIYSSDLIEFVSDSNEHLYPIPIGSSLSGLPILKHKHDGHVIFGEQPKSKLVETALLYLNSPYLWGGKTPFGLDCSGFTQMVYKINGYSLFRDASQQAAQGEVLSFIEETEPGDLAFFDNKDGEIIHVGIILKDNHIIHAHGKVRIDRLDQSGIHNTGLRRHTHKLRVIKKII
ncbi:MAG: C40 family peptidase [Flavobacteriaceae bacterium]|nr:C40 family peptidase [Bacteroidia bacterium]MBT8288442.1 C40 family peptidase [Bacteroidia bacterium]NNF73860.1 C40 family peptidase [Flavobacteriaceae bacterium]NNK74164.1 C40 family peptidase [Flavobacteriaceae bacterium]